MRLGALKAREIIGTVAKLMRALKGRKRSPALSGLGSIHILSQGVKPLAIISRAFSALEEAPTKSVRIISFQFSVVISQLKTEN
jgi:hypothetical protein